tara:strand:- start:2082 stop:6227 length:4146 start_codon:yes stop_codon:yes gene_type:complete
VPTIQEKLLDMEDLGYSELEREQYKNSQIENMTELGYSQEDIFKQLGLVHPNTLEKDEVVKKQNKGFWQTVRDNVAEDLNETKKFLVGERFEVDVKAALSKTFYNTVLQLKDKGIPLERAFRQDEDKGVLEEALESIITLVPDLPFYGASIAGATAATGNPVTGTAVGLSIPASIRSIAMDQIEAGRVQNFSQFWNKWFIEALPKDLQNDPQILGFISGLKGIGKGVKESALLVGTGGATKVLDATNIPRNVLTEAAARTTAFTSIGAALEGQMPTTEDFVVNSLVFTKLGMAEKAITMMRNSSKTTLKHPAETTRKILEDPVMLAEAVSTTHKSFTQERQLNKNLIEQTKKEIETLRQDKEFVDNPSANKIKLDRYKDAKQILNDLAEPFEPIKTLKSFEKTEKTRKTDQEQPTQQELNLAKEKQKPLDEKLQKAEKNFNDNIPEGKVKQEVDKSVFNRKMQYLSDKLFPILEVAESGKKIGNKTAENIYERFRIQPGMIGRGEHAIRYGTLDYKTLNENGKGLLQILEPILKSEKDYTNFKNYAVAKRVVEKEGQGKQTGFNVEDAKIIIKQYDTKFNKTFKDFVDYNQRILRYVYDSGVISKQFYEKALELNKDYVPFARELDLKLPDSKVGSFLRNPMKEFKGSEKRVYDPIETAYLNTYQFIALAEKNAVLRDFVDMAMSTKKTIEGKVKNIDEKITDLNEKLKTKEEQRQKTRNTAKVELLEKDIEKLKQEIDIQTAKKNDTFLSFGYDKPNQVSKVAAQTKGFKLSKKEAEKLFDDPTKINEKLLEELTVFRKQTKGLTDTQISIRRDGKLEVYEVGPELRKALRDIPKPVFDNALRIMGLPTRVLRAGATLDVAFMARNFFRGELAATAFSKNNYIPLVHGSLGVFRLVQGKNKQTQLYKDFIKSGALQSSLVSFDRKYIREGFMKEELTSRKLVNSINPKNTLENLRILAEFAESAARISEFRMQQKRLTKEGKKSQREILEESGLSARDITLDFQKIGLSMQAVNSVTAFYNARLRGYEQVISGVIKNPTKVLSTLIITQTLPSVYLWFANKDSEYYRNLPQWVKDTHHIVILNQGKPNEIAYKIPKLWELGFIFGTLPERALDFIAKKDPKAIEQLGKELYENSGNFLVNLAPLPEIGRVPLELAVNKSFFQDRPIVPRSMENILPEYQTTPYTSEIAKGLGRMIRAIPGLEDYSSPIQIDYLIKAWTGGLGKYALDATNAILRKAGVGDDTIRPWSDNYVKNLENMPFFRSFVVRKLSPGAEPLSDFWNEYSKIKTKLETARALRKRNQFQEAAELLSPREQALDKLIDFADSIKSLGDLVYLQQRIPKDSTDITPNEVRDNIDTLLEGMIKIANGANKYIKEVDKSLD